MTPLQRTWMWLIYFIVNSIVLISLYSLIPTFLMCSGILLSGRLSREKKMWPARVKSVFSSGSHETAYY